MRNKIPFIEFKKINMIEGELSKIIYFDNEYDASPAVNILGNTNQNIFISEIDNQKFNLKRSDDKYNITILISVCEVV